jgi:hypothetical protein
LLDCIAVYCKRTFGTTIYIERENNKMVSLGVRTPMFSCTSQRNQKSELMERARQFTYTLQHPHSRVTGEEKVNTWTQTGEEKVNTWTQRGATAILQ